MSDANPEVAPESGESGAVIERPKSRLPRLPTSSTPKPPENDAPDLMTAVKAVQKASTNAQTEAKINTHALSVRQYLETSVVPVLMRGLISVVSEIAVHFVLHWN